MDYDQALRLLNSLKQRDLKMSDKKWVLQMKKKLESRRAELNKKKTLEQLAFQISQLRKQLERIREQLSSSERFVLMNQANQTKDLIEALAYSLEQHDDLHTKKLVADSKKVVNELLEEQQNTFVSQKKVIGSSYQSEVH